MTSHASIQRSIVSFSRFLRIARPAATIGILIAAISLASCGQDVDASPSQTESITESASMTPASGGIDANKTSELAYWPLWQCNAYPVNGMPFMYWIHANAIVAARSAMNACWYTYYVPCNYRCFRVR